VSRPYIVLGIVLSLSGAILCPVFYFIAGSPALTAVSLSAVMLGLTSIALANARPFVSPEACRVLLSTGIENTAALLEELQLTHKAIYISSRSSETPVRVLIPLNEGIIPSDFGYNLNRLILRYGRGESDMAIAVATPGTTCLKLLESRPAFSAEDIEFALNHLLTGILDIADSVVVRAQGNRFSINIRGNRLPGENAFYEHCLGSPVASIAAAVTCYAASKAVRIFSEESRNKGRDLAIELEVVD